MRRMTYFVMALALVLGFTQCKKDQIEPQGERVHITLDVDGGNSNSKVVVNPTGASTYATVDFEEGDVIYVGYNNAYVGTLTYSDGVFGGDIDITQSGNQPLHFYCLGGQGFTVNRDGNIATVVISDQSSKYPVISYATSKQNYPSDGNTYTAKLMNKCSIMKFNVTKPSEGNIRVTGMNNKVTLNFNPEAEGTDDGFTYSQVDAGLITIPGVASSGASTWAIVLPQANVTDGHAYSVGSNIVYTRPAIAGGIGSNQYLNDGITLTEADPLVIPYATPTSVSADGTANYSLGGGKPVSGCGKANITANNEFQLTFKANGTAIIGKVDFGSNEPVRIRFYEDDVVGDDNDPNNHYYIINPGATALTNTDYGLSIPDYGNLHIYGNVDCYEIYVDHANIYVEGNLNGTVTLGAGAILRVRGDISNAEVKNSNDEYLEYTEVDGYKVYQNGDSPASSLLRLDIEDPYGDGIVSIFYVAGETWAQAIDRHSSENADWSYFEDPEDPESYYVSYYYDYDDQYWWVNSDNGLISPNDEIDPNSNYSLY